MSATIGEVVLSDLPAPQQGKVRQLFDLGDRLLLVATDRISAFDVVLPTLIPDKGAVLTQLSAFWFEATRHLIPNHLITADTTLLPPELARHEAQLKCRTTLGRKARRVDVECVARGYLAGSAWSDYQKTGHVGEFRLPSGLRESEELPEPLFTPTTKAEAGHDMPMTYGQVESLVGVETAALLREKTLAVYDWARQFARERGIIIADTKMEFGLTDDGLILIDELLTPDSSRFWPADEYRPGSSPPSFDKQYVRDFLSTAGWNRQPPAPELPAEVVARTTQKYREAYRRLVGRELEC